MVPAQISMPLIACLAMTLPEQEIKEVLSSLSQSKVGHACQDSARLFELVFGELHKLAADRLRRERPDHTLQPTALVNEVYLRLVAGNDQKQWDNTGHFFAAAARAMRQILIDNARRKLASKRSGSRQRADIDLNEITDGLDDQSLIELHDALSELEKVDPEKAQLVELKFFGGLSMEQTCDCLHISRTTAHRHWKQAQAWLFLRITEPK